MDDFAFVRRVLAIYDEADVHPELNWHVRDGVITFYAMCNDTFYWATADAEEITPDNLPVLEAALADLKAIDAEVYLSDMFAARVRHMRPQRPWYASISKYYPGQIDLIVALFDACGPERDPESEG